MVAIANDQEELKRIKENIEAAHEAFSANYDRFNEFVRFVFIKAMTTTDDSYNKTLQRPTLEFPILEPMISRLCGEFAKNIPSIKVMPRSGSSLADEFADEQQQQPNQPGQPSEKKKMARQIEVIEGLMRHILTESNKKHFEYNCYRDTLTGGYSNAIVYRDFDGDSSFHQELYIRRCFDQTLVAHDPMAREDDKSDARFQAEIYPMYKEDFENEFGEPFEKVKATTTVGRFQWTFKAVDKDVILVASYYEKKKRDEVIVQVRGGETMTMKEYKKLQKDWTEAGIIEQLPVIINKRKTTLTKIMRYIVCENKILRTEETDYHSLPITFIDGNSIPYKEANNSSVTQFTRPLVYSARDAQRLKNFAGQALANELENIPQHKWMAPLEGIPENYSEPYQNVQKADILIYNAFRNNDVNVPLPSPQAVPRVPIEPIIMQTFMATDTMVQNSLGAFDPAIAKLGEREVSGIAIQESLSLSNAAAMPYVVNYLKGLQSIANKVLEMIPSTYINARTIPILTAEGKKEYVKINQEGGTSLKYEKNALKVSVEAGPSFQIQQQQALREINEASKMSPVIGQYFATEGFKYFLDNMSFRGVELAKENIDEWMAKMEQERQKAQQSPPPEIVKMQIEQAKLQQKTQQEQIENRLAAAELELEKQKLLLKSAEIMAKLEGDRLAAEASEKRSQSELLSKAAEMTIRTHETVGKMSHEQKKLEHEIEQASRETNK